MSDFSFFLLFLLLCLVICLILILVSASSQCWLVYANPTSLLCHLVRKRDFRKEFMSGFRSSWNLHCHASRFWDIFVAKLREKNWKIWWKNTTVVIKNFIKKFSFIIIKKVKTIIGRKRKGEKIRVRNLNSVCFYYFFSFFFLL